jgi:hypothetical protein
MLKPHNVLIPAAGTYRSSIAKALGQLDGLPPTQKEEDALFETISANQNSQDAQHMVLINEDWIGDRRSIFQGGKLYGSIDENAAALTELFTHHDLRISIALRNPALLMNHAHLEPRPSPALSQFLEQHDPMHLSWLDTIRTLRDVLPDIPLLLWCEEDTPLIWPRILQSLTNISTSNRMLEDSAATIEAMTPEGAQKFQALLQSNYTETMQNYEKIALEFLDKYADPTVTKTDCVVPNWTRTMIDTLSERYNDDIAALSAEDGITFILPQTQ